MKNRNDVERLLIDYLFKRGDLIDEGVIDYCLNQIEAGFGKRALKGRLNIDIKNINFSDWNSFYDDLLKALYR